MGSACSCCCLLFVTRSLNIDRAVIVKNFNAQRKAVLKAKEASAPRPKEGEQKLAYTVAFHGAAKVSVKLGRADGSGDRAKSVCQQQQLAAQLTKTFFKTADGLAANGKTQVLAVVFTSIQPFAKQNGPGRPAADGHTTNGKHAVASRVQVSAAGFDAVTPQDAAALAATSAVIAAISGGVQPVEHPTADVPPTSTTIEEKGEVNGPFSRNCESEDWDSMPADTRGHQTPTTASWMSPSSGKKRPGSFQSHADTYRLNVAAEEAATAAAAAAAAATAASKTPAQVAKEKADKINRGPMAAGWRCHPNPRLPHTPRNPPVFYHNTSSDQTSFKPPRWTPGPVISLPFCLIKHCHAPSQHRPGVTA